MAFMTAAVPSSTVLRGVRPAERIMLVFMYVAGCSDCATMPFGFSSCARSMVNITCESLLCP